MIRERLSEKVMFGQVLGRVKEGTLWVPGGSVLSRANSMCIYLGLMGGGGLGRSNRRCVQRANWGEEG